MMFLVYLAMLLEPMAVLATSVTQFQNNLSGFDRVLDLLAEPREMADCPGTRPVSKHAVAGPDHAPGRRLRLSGNDPPGAARHRPRRRAGRDDRPGRPERIGQDDALQPDRPVLRPDHAARSRSTASTSARSRSRATAACWGSSSRTSSSSTARSPRTSPTATAGRRGPGSSKPPGRPTPPSSSIGCPTATTP